MQWHPLLKRLEWPICNRCGIDDVERALAEEIYRAIQARNASATASGRSMVDRCPQSCAIASFDPAIPSAIVRAKETGVRASSLPTSTSVGQLIAPNDGRESGLDMIAFC
jgi:hypothetical protein